jgi:DNA-binding MarR family transcriptional regulator
MSVYIWREVWEIPLKPPEKLLLLALADHAHKDGRNCYPSVARLAERTGFSARHVYRILRGLEQDGYIRRIRPSGNHRAVTWEVLPNRGDKMSSISASGVTTSNAGMTNASIRDDMGVTLTTIEPLIKPFDAKDIPPFLNGDKHRWEDILNYADGTNEQRRQGESAEMFASRILPKMSVWEKKANDGKLQPDSGESKGEFLARLACKRPS